MPDISKLAKGLTAIAKGAKEEIPFSRGVKTLSRAESDENLRKMLESSKIKERLFHATPEDIKFFKPGGLNPKMSGEAIWLSPDPAKTPAAHNIGYYDNPRQGVNIMPVHVQAKNPMILDDVDMLKWAQQVYGEGSREFPQLMPKKWREEVMKDYDSIVLADPYKRGDPHEVIMFEPEKIKSAIGNRGTYNTDTADITKAKGGAIRMQVGGLSALAKLGTAGTKLTKAEIASLRARGMGVPSIDFADSMNPKDIMRMSEALGASGSEGKTLNLTQADRSRVFGPNKGGTGFSGLQLTSPAHQQAGTTWGVGKPSHVTRMVNANTPETVWSTFIGSPTQHMSNPVTVERMYEAHKNANPSAQLVEDMNKMLNSAVVKKKGKPDKLAFPNGIDISDPASLNQAQTFDQRKLLAKAMVMGGEKKGEKATQEAFKIIKEETDPLLMDAPTYAVGNRLFTIDKDTGIYRPDLNKAFPEQTVGTDFGLIFEPAPIELAAPDFVKKFEGRTNKHGNPQAMGHKDLTATTPKQFISEEYLTNLQKEGYKNGGSAEPPPFHDFDQIMKRKDGGTVNTFEQRLKSALHMAMGGEVSDNTIPDRTDSGNTNYGGMYAGGGTTRRYAEAGSVPAPTPQELEKMADAQGAAFGVFPQMASQRFQQPSPTMDKASEMLKAQVTKEWEQAGKPGGAKGLSLRIGAVLAGQVPDIVNLGQSMIPSLNKPASVLDPEGEKVARFPMSGTSTDIKNSMREKGIINEDEYPIAEMLGAFAAPYAAVKAPRAIEGGLNSVTAAARRPFTPATLTTEAVAPDLAKFKPREFQDEVTRRMIGEGAAVPMTNMGGRKTTQRGGQGVYMNNEGQLELNPMVGVDIPRAGNLSTNKSLRRDIATAGQELNQEAMAAHRFVPMATNNIKDATAMMVTGANGRALSNEEVIALGKNIPGLIVSHSPRTGGVFLANDPYAGGDPMKKFLNAQSVAGQILGNKAKIQFGKADPNKDLMYMMRHQYAEEGGRGTSPTAQAIRESLKRKDQTIPTVRN